MLNTETLGPWIAEHVSSDEYEHWQVSFGNANNCFKPVETGETSDHYMCMNGICTEREARAMAAAPDLLEAARAAMQCIGELAPSRIRAEVAAMLTEAISKATGVQS